MTTDGQQAVKGGDSSSPAGESMMQAIVQDRYGSPDVLHLARITRPVPTGNEVLIRMHAAGLDRGTWHLMTGRPYLLRLGFGLRGPKTRVPGLDVAGTIVAVGPAATRFAVGEAVFGIGQGSFAEYVVAREDKLARKPGNVSFAHASAVPASAVAALQALRAAGGVEQGQRALIIGASGGIGSYAVQLAKAFGAEVTGVCSTAKMDLVRSLGADHVIDYTRDDFADGAQRYDLILDIAGNPGLSRLRRALAPTGTAVITGGEEGGSWTGGIDRQLRALALSPFVGQRLTTFIAQQRASDLEQLTDLIDAGTVTPRIDRTFPLEEVPAAMRYLAAGKVRGKIAITL